MEPPALRLLLVLLLILFLPVIVWSVAGINMAGLTFWALGFPSDIWSPAPLPALLSIAPSPPPPLLDWRDRRSSFNVGMVILRCVCVGYCFFLAIAATNAVGYRFGVRRRKTIVTLSPKASLAFRRAGVTLQAKFSPIFPFSEKSKMRREIGEQQKLRGQFPRRHDDATMES